MTDNMRFLAIFILNIALTAAMLAWQQHNGIDIHNTKFVDNLDNATFVLDFIAFMVASLVLNVILLLIPSKKHLMLMKALKYLSENAPPKPRRQKRHPA